MQNFYADIAALEAQLAHVESKQKRRISAFAFRLIVNVMLLVYFWHIWWVPWLGLLLLAFTCVNVYLIFMMPKQLKQKINTLKQRMHQVEQLYNNCED
ncbi:MAG: hypothetical protein ACK4HE_00920 [Chitinophagaceae bacterium]